MRPAVSAVLIFLALTLAAPLLPEAASRDLAIPTHTTGSWAASECRACLHPDSRRTFNALHADRRRFPPPVALRVAAGYGERYRRSAWVPVRVSIRNRTTRVVQGTVAIPDQGGARQFATPAYNALYQIPVVLPPGATKEETLYLPGQDVGDEVEVQFRAGGQVAATASASPNTLDDKTISLGALAHDAQIVSWLYHLKPSQSSVDVVQLSPSTLDPVAEALASFDAIVLSNVDTSRLDGDQVRALERYVHDGGSLILVGGPDWQETLRPLPQSLVPGELSGSRAVPNLSGLQVLSGDVPPTHATIVSVLTHPRGSVVASEAGVPLMVRSALGKGHIIYLAFDPAVDFISRGSGSASLLSDLVMQATPQVVTRLSSSSSGPGGFGGRFGPTVMRQELANVPTSIWPSLFLLIFLTVFSILLVGPINFLLLHRLGKRELAWVTIPALAFLCLGSTIGIVFRLKGNIALLNTVSMVELDGDSSRHTAAMYIGLFAPVRGDYHMVWQGSALPQNLPLYSWDQGSSAGPSVVGVRLQEGAQTAVDFPAMSMWSTRSVALRTTVTVPGTVHSDLRVAPDGSIAGVVRNDTSLTLIRPVVMAGGAVLHLPDLSPKSTRVVRIRPSVDAQRDGGSFLWDQIYGSSSASSEFRSWDGDPWEEPALATEGSLTDRLRNVTERLPEARDVTSWGEVLFAGWSEDPLGTLTVEGVTPRRRDLNLIVAPLSVQLPAGSFQLLPGTLAAHLVDARPQPPQSGCCSSSSATPAIDLGTGSSATFQFDLPNARHIRFRRLNLSVHTDAADASRIGQVYDWRAGRWVHADLQSGQALLPDPDRFISLAGALLVRLHGTGHSGDLVIPDPRQDLQLSGWATAR